MKLICALALLALASPSWAAPGIVVDSVKMPAWIERGPQRLPAAPGAAIHKDDVLVTGDQSRLLLKTADGSAIKLGENARLRIAGLGQKKEKGGGSILTAFLDVAKGAFRFTTGALERLRGREVAVKVAGATLGIRGTDVWGKAQANMSVSALELAMGKDTGRADKDARLALAVICLIEGKISVTPDREAPFVMDQPRSFYVMPSNEDPLPVSPLAAEQLRKWSEETEIADGQGAARRGGQWQVRLLTTSRRRGAVSVQNELRVAGYDARLRQMPSGAYRVSIPHLSSREDAEALAQMLAGKMGVAKPAVIRSRAATGSS